ncbi:hypothetical protein FHU38_001327 [Saccharomonospora amisosensis]|uniref:Phospholipase A2 n=1 Tax=Saccharomonospora amisosensis TaxID=1128677 RepID=A0A7X5UMX9_9PSEU|nr:phospholipase A2 [Saccharomonospora amisosensis]NIJ10983.1 hypothetical protein [Saccharomonospora amisosensis]
MPEQGEESPHASRRRHGVVGTTAWLVLLVLAVTSFGFVASRAEAVPQHGPLRQDTAAAARAIEALLAPGPSADALTLLPSDFTEVTGVIPGSAAARDGSVRAVHVDGGCSTPWGDDNTRWDFGTACRSHDLGYDLLRYAEKKGQPLGPQVRKALDDRLSADMHATCRYNPQDSRQLCEAVASVYSAGLVVNSWHQRWGPPVGEPIVPLLAGVAAIGLLLAFRLRGWLLARRHRPKPRAVAGAPRTPVPGRRWTLLGVGSIGVLMLGESAVALASWVGVGQGWLWPLTWVAQLSLLFFFAGGHANARCWLAVVESGGGYREYLAHRASWLLRLTLVFAVVAFLVPIALELLRIPEGTTAVVMRIALHPLWLLGLYVLTVVATPAMFALYRRAPLVVPLALAAVLVLAEWLAAGLGLIPLRDLAALVLALLGQQLAFAHHEGHSPRRWVMGVVAVAGSGALAAGAVSGVVPLTMLGTPAAAPSLSGPALPVLLLGAVQLSVLGLVRRPLSGLAARPWTLRLAGFAARAPMSLYLLFLSGMLLLVAAVYLPGRFGTDLAWVLRPRPLLALALLTGPAAMVFLWFERHLGHRPPPLPTWRPVPAGLDRFLARAATAAGIGYSTAGIFGFALTSFGDTEITVVPGLLLDPVQSLVHLLLGMSLLHSVRTGVSSAPSTWLLTALACVPPLLFASTAPDADAIGVAVPVATGALAVAAAVLTGVFSPSRAARP